MDYNGLLNLGSQLGRQLMTSGAEISRVEDSILRLMQAYGVHDAQVFAIPNCLIVCLTPPDGQPITRVSRIPAHGLDLDRLELYNAACRRLCRELPPPDQAQQQVAHIAQHHPHYRDRAVIMGHFLAAAFFTFFFGGSSLDSLCGGLCGVAIALSTRLLRHVAGTGAFFHTLMSAALTSLLAQFFVWSGVAHNADAITIGALMLLVPGVALTTAMREVLAGDIVSGITRTTESVLTATAIALGTGAALALAQLL